VALQKRLDFDNLALSLVTHDSMHWKSTGETIFPMLSDKRLKVTRRDEAITELLRAAIFKERFDLAVKIWNNYALVITRQPASIIASLLESFEKSAGSFEFKAFFFKQLYMEMTPVHFDRILTSVEKRLLPLEDGDSE
jgi:hypothetical protein